MSKIKISIVTPSYNQGMFIEETINSVLNQGYPNLEYIIMDGGSKDNTVDIIKKYESKISYWVSEKDNGQTHAINKGFERATGEVIAWLNSDDVYCENALNAVADYFEQNPDCHWLAGNLLFMNAEGKVYIRKYPNSSRLLEKMCMFSIYQPNVFLRRSLLTEVGYPREEYHMTMDYEWFCRIAAKHRLHILDQDVARFRWHADSKSSSAPNTIHQQKYHKEALQLVKTYYPQYKWAAERYPKLTLFVWFQTGKVMRLLTRIGKGELKKLNAKVA